MIINSPLNFVPSVLLHLLTQESSGLHLIVVGMCTVEIKEQERQRCPVGLRCMSSEAQTALLVS